MKTWQGLMILQRRVSVRKLGNGESIGRITWPVEFAASSYKQAGSLDDPPEGDLAAWVEMTREHVDSLFEEGDPRLRTAFTFESHDGRFTSSIEPTSVAEGIFSASNVRLLTLAVKER